MNYFSSIRRLMILALFAGSFVGGPAARAEDGQSTIDHSPILSDGVLSNQFAERVSAIEDFVKKQNITRENFLEQTEKNQQLKTLVSKSRSLLRGFSFDDEKINQTLLVEVYGPEVGTGSPEGEKDSDEETPEEKEAREAAERRAAKDSADRRGNLRDLEDELERREREEELQRLEQARGRGDEESSGGGGGGGGEPSSPPFSPPSSNNNSSDNSNQNSAIDKLADRLGGISQPNFSSPSSPKKNEPEKPKFSLDPSKSSLAKSSEESNKAKSKKPSLPELAASNQGGDENSDVDFVGTPIPLKPSNKPQASFNSNGGGAAAGGGAAGAGAPGAGGMGGILAGGQAGFSPMGEQDSSFPFDITGEAYGEESEYEDWPRFRVFKIPMSGGGGFGSFGSSASGGGENNSDSSQKAKLKNIKNNSFYYLSSAEASLKDVPGVFRSMASGYKKSRVQNLCENFPQLKIGLCQRSPK